MMEVLFVLLQQRLISVLSKIFCLTNKLNAAGKWTCVSLLRLLLQAKDLGPNEYLCGSSYGQAKVELTTCVWSTGEFEALAIFRNYISFNYAGRKEFRNAQSPQSSAMRI